MESCFKMVSYGFFRKTEKTSNASSDTGSWIHGNPTTPEDKANELGNILKKLMKRGNINY